MTETEQREAEREEAIEHAAVALGLSRVYDIELRYTARGEDCHSITASSMEVVKKYCMEAKRSIEDLDGDEIAYVRIDVDDIDADPEEIDCRDAGEPFSWEACNFVKEFAKVEVHTAEAMHEWVNRAKCLLK